MKEQNSKETIMNCALALFYQKGYDGTGINEIVEQAGVTKPTLYYFFGSKEGLFEELLSEYFAKLYRSMEQDLQYRPNPDQYELDVMPLLRRIAESFFQFAKDHTKFYMMVMAFGFAPPSSVAAVRSEEYLKKQYLMLEGTMKEISAVHKNLRGKERQCSWRLLAMINAQIAFWNMGYGTIEQEDAQSIAVQFMHGVFS